MIIVELYPQYILKRLKNNQFNADLRAFDYLLFSENYPEGRILTFKEWINCVRAFKPIDEQCASSIQLPIDRTFFRHSHKE